MNSVGYLFQLSYWQSSLAFLFLIIGGALVIYVHKKKGRNVAFLAGAIIGIIGGLMFMTLDIYYPMQFEAMATSMFTINEVSPRAPGDPVYSWHQEALSWLNLIPGIFLSGLYFCIPLLVFSTLISVINKFTDSKATGQLFQSMIVLTFMVMLGILVALIFTPIWETIQFNSYASATPPESSIDEPTIPGIIGSWVPASLSIFSSVKFMVPIVIASIVIGFAIRFLIRTNNSSGIPIKNFFSHIHELFKVVISWVMKLIPLMVMSKIPTLFFGEVANNMSSLGIFIGMTVVGAIILFVVEILLGIIFSSKARGITDYLKITWKPTTTAFFSQSSSGTLPVTIEATEKLVKDPSLATITPSLGTTMGLSMCGGFYPVSITIITAFSYSLFTAGSADPYVINSTFWVTLIISAIIVSFGTAGVPGTASVTTNALLAATGLPADFYLAAQAVDPFIDMIRTAVNVNGVISATTMLDWFSSKFSKKRKNDIEDPLLENNSETKETKIELDIKK